MIFASSVGEGLVRFDSQDEDSERRRLVTFAVRASMSLPGFFKAPLLDGRRMFDGGLLANFPAREWVQLYPTRPFIGIYLGPPTPPGLDDSSVVADAIDVITTRDDYPFIQSHRDQVVMVDPEPIETTDFGLSSAEADFLVLQGRACALEHMARVLQDEELAEESVEIRSKAEAAKQIAINARRSRKRWVATQRACVLLLVLAATATVGRWSYNAIDWTSGCHAFKTESGWTIARDDTNSAEWPETTPEGTLFQHSQANESDDFFFLLRQGLYPDGMVDNMYLRIPKRGGDVSWKRRDIDPYMNIPGYVVTCSE